MGYFKNHYSGSSISPADTGGISVSVDVDMTEVNERIYQLGRGWPDERIKEVLNKASLQYINEVRYNAPEAEVIVKRYRRSGIGNRSGGGKVKPYAIYYPGNLARSFRVMEKLRKLKRGIVIGPDANKNPKGHFRGSKVDGWYAHMVEGGTKYQKANPFIGKSWRASKRAVISVLEEEFRSEILKRV